MRAPYTKQQVTEAVERRAKDGRIPTFMCLWWGNGLVEKYGEDALKRLELEYPDDIIGVFYNTPEETVSNTSNPEYRWGFKDYTGKATHSIGKACVLLEDWAELDEFEKHMPDPMEPGTFDNVSQAVENAGGRYVLGCFWRVFHERFWSIRGMENLMYDYYDAMDELKRLGQILLAYYKRIIDRFAACGVDGIFTSDDLGHQKGPMMSPAVFHELYFPLYKEIIAYTHAKGMHFFLHSCGDNTLLMEDLIQAGLDVFHPVQAGCMDYVRTAEQFGSRLTFLYGIDVQHLLPEGSLKEVRDGIVTVAKTMYKPHGGLLFAAGNGIMPDSPIENIETMLQTVHEMNSLIS